MQIQLLLLQYPVVGRGTQFLIKRSWIKSTGKACL